MYTKGKIHFSYLVVIHVSENGNTHAFPLLVVQSWVGGLLLGVVVVVGLTVVV